MDQVLFRQTPQHPGHGFAGGSGIPGQNGLGRQRINQPAVRRHLVRFGQPQQLKTDPLGRREFGQVHDLFITAPDHFRHPANQRRREFGHGDHQIAEMFRRVLGQK